MVCDQLNIDKLLTETLNNGAKNRKSKKSIVNR